MDGIGIHVEISLWRNLCENSPSGGNLFNVLGEKGKGSFAILGLQMMGRRRLGTEHCTRSDIDGIYDPIISSRACGLSSTTR